ncbi:MAG: VWA domain-containing protein [Verrucomicrobia bacterium]|nr:VWA domain-containing protein [Verrucomicrobiota bacterium]
MRFEHPNILWLLAVVVPALVAFFWWSWRERQRLVTQFIEARLLPALTVGVSATRQKLRMACVILAVALVIAALARPQVGFHWEETKLRGLDIVVAIDTSKSMLATDINPNRLARAKLAALELMQVAKSDRLGLVAFAGSAFLQCPLTADDTAFRQSVEALDVNIIPQGGTAIAEAINITSTAFKEGDSHRVLVLFSDGEDNDEGALAAAQAAAKDGLKIFTIGVGTTEGELLNPSLVRDEHGSVVKSHLNEKLLQDIAQATGGFYLPLRGAKTIDTLYEKGLAALPKAEQSAKLVKRWHERFHWPLAAAILLLLLEILWPERKKSKVQSPKSNGAATAVALLILSLPIAAAASPRSALKDYRSGKFPASLVEYERLIEKDKTGDLRLQFNAGAAAYGATNYDAAIRHYTAVLPARDVKLQQAAYFNIGNALFRQGQAAKDLDGMQEQWENAIKFYQYAATLDKTDRDAVYNLAFAKKCVEQIVALREAARRARAAADSATRQRRYHEALEIMQPLVQNNPTAKQFEDFVKKLKDIDDIATPHQP